MTVCASSGRVLKLAQVTPPRVLTIAGSDPSGGAGLQADVKTFQALGCYGMAVVTALTAQDTTGVHAVHLPGGAFVRAQLDAVLGDCPPAAVKTGMLPTADVVRTVADALRELAAVRLVVDPVLVATSGDSLADENVVGALREFLVPMADIVTPNAYEARALTGVRVTDPASGRVAASALVELGARAAVVTGGDVRGDTVYDVLVTRDPSGMTERVAPRIGAGPTHGTGCTFAAALVARLAHGASVRDAFIAAHAFVRTGLESAFAVGRGAVPVNHLAARTEDRT